MKMVENNLILYKYRRGLWYMAFPCFGRISWQLVTCLRLATTPCPDLKMKKIKIFPSRDVHSGHMDTLIGSAYYGANSMSLYH